MADPRDLKDARTVKVALKCRPHSNRFSEFSSAKCVYAFLNGIHTATPPRVFAAQISSGA